MKMKFVLSIFKVLPDKESYQLPIRKYCGQ